MNIFASDRDPVKSAQALDNKRLVKMILESAQLLCTALHLNNASHLAKYKMTHKNHPSAVWARATRGNYLWLLEHFKALCEEYTYRYLKIHASEALYNDLLAGAQFIPNGPFTDVANCAARDDLGFSYKHIGDVYLAYKLYLMRRWSLDKKVSWGYRNAPDWMYSRAQLKRTMSVLFNTHNNNRFETNP